jgi:hypothetical protein
MEQSFHNDPSAQESKHIDVFILTSSTPVIYHLFLKLHTLVDNLY